MKIKEAILKSLDELNKPVNYKEVTDHIIQNQYFNFGGKKPAITVSAQLGEFIRLGDSRIKRIKQANGSYLYYLTKNEQGINFEILSPNSETQVERQASTTKTFEERDLHILLTTYLKNIDIYSKTIFHESSNNKDSNQIWTHPDIVGVKFLQLQTTASQNFLKAINRLDALKLYSYEIKKEITNDNELKKAFFQAVSNSSWANYGFLVAFEFSYNLLEEMSRLNQAFGIGIIELNSNPYQSKILFPAKYRDLDFKTIDKLCNINEDFKKFIEYTEKLVSADERYIYGTETELKNFCDKYFTNDSEIEKYCEEKNIPLDEKSEIE